MKTLGLVLALLSVPFAALAQDAAPPQDVVIDSAEVQGLAIDQLSPELRRDIEGLAGARLDRERLAALAARIEAEHPDVVAAVRDVARTDGRVRVVFFVARISDDTSLSSNINTRYLVERVEIAGIDEARISQALRDELQTLVGRRLDADEAGRLTGRLEAELPDYTASHTTSRGDESGRIRVVFHLRRSEESWRIPFQPLPWKLLYHQDQGWSGMYHFGVGAGRSQFTLGLMWGNNDDLIEEYSGYRFRVETREAGTKGLGVSLEVSKLFQTWREATLSGIASNPEIPDPYRTRMTVQPAVIFAPSPRVRLMAGVAAVELEPLAESVPLTEPAISQKANAAFLSIGYDQKWRPEYAPATHPGTPFRHRLEASYQLRVGTTALNSDLVYKRHFGSARYRYDHGRNTFLAELLVGRITGRAPLFERFSLGDSSTLRGWDKFAIVPVGADRIVHQSVEYRYRSFAYFVDVGSTWVGDTGRRVRLSTGVGFHGEWAFLTVGLPLNADDVSARIMLGLQF